MSQDSLGISRNNNGISSATEPLFVIKGEDIKRFPVTDFFEAVEGMFPWVFNGAAQQKDFLFVVNGHLLSNINGISLYDMEEIVFTRNNLYGGILPFSKAGTFFITTSIPPDEKLSVQFNTQLNRTGNMQQAYTAADGFSTYTQVLKNEISNTAGDYWMNHISIAQSGKKNSFRASGFFNSGKIPGSRQNFITQSAADTTTLRFNGQASGKQQLYGLLADYTHRFSATAEAGVMLNYSSRQMSFDSTESQTASFFTTTASGNEKIPLHTFTANAYVQWQLLPHWNNRFSIEYASHTFHAAGTKTAASIYGASFIQNDYNSTTNYKYEGLLLKNECRYDAVTKPNFKARIYLNTVWYKPAATLTTDYAGRSSTGSYFTESSSHEGDQKTGVVNPAFHFEYKNFVSTYAGAGYLVGKKMYADVKRSDRVSMYYGIDLSLNNILHLNKDVSVLQLSFNHAAAAMSTSIAPINTAWLQLNNTFLSYFRYNAVNGEYDLAKNRLTSLKLSAGAYKNRLLFISEWSKLTYDKTFMYTIYAYPVNYTAYVQGSETAEGISFGITGTLIDKKELKLFTAWNVLVPKIKSGEPNPVALNYMNYKTLHAGIQNKIVYKNIFCQLHALFNFNRPYPAAVAGANKTKTDMLLQYLLLGYHTTSHTKGILKNSTVFMHARNLLVSDPLKELHLYNRYAGIGINLEL